MLGVVPVWSSAFRAASGTNTGRTGAQPWSMQALVRQDARGLVSPILRMSTRIGTAGAGTGAYSGQFRQGTTGDWPGHGDYGLAGVSLPSRTGMVANQWYLRTTTYDGTTLREYVDDVLVLSTVVALNLGAAPLSISDASFFWSGPMCRIGQWARALTLAEIQATFANPFAAETQAPVRFYRCNEGSGTTLVDRGSAGDNATITGTPVWAAASGTWHRTKEVCVDGESHVSGTVTNPAGWRRALNGLLTRKVSFVGERTAEAGTTAESPFDGGYYNGGVSGQTLKQVTNRTCGTWGNDTAFTLGAGGDPGPGSRGEGETLAARAVGEGGGDISLIIQCMTNDALAGAIDLNYVEVAVKRRIAVHQANGRRVRDVLLMNGMPIIGDATANARVVTGNAGYVSQVRPNLISAGIDVTVLDVYGLINTGTDMGDNYHANPTGSLKIANAALAWVQR